MGFLQRFDHDRERGSGDPCASEKNLEHGQDDAHHQIGTTASIRITKDLDHDDGQVSSIAPPQAF